MIINKSFKHDLYSFCTNNKMLCIFTLGLAIAGFTIGNLGGRGVSWLSKVFGVTEKADSVAQEKFDALLLKEPLGKMRSQKHLEQRKSLSKKDNLIVDKSLSILSSPQIKSCATVELPNYTSVHINEQGEVFYLTPIGGSNIDQYSEKLDEYTKACLEIELEEAYNKDGHLMHHGEIIKQSIAKKIENLHAKEHVVNLWIQACHFIIVKSDQGRYWFLHYDPGQSKHQQNQIDGLQYPRPNYSELRPVLPYNLDGIALKDNEKIQVLVVHPSRKYSTESPDNLSNGEFDVAAFRNYVGEDNVISIKTICYKDFVKEKNQPIEIDFKTKCETLTVYLKGQRNEPICNLENYFTDF